MTKRQGFTLIEILIYTGIFAVVGGLMTTILLTATRFEAQTTGSTEIANQLNFVLQTIQRLVRESSAIIVNNNAIVGSSTNNVSNDTLPIGQSYQYLVLRMKDSGLNPATDRDPIIIWKDATGTVKIKQGASGAISDLTTSRLTIDNLDFTKSATYPGHDSVAIYAKATYAATSATQSPISRSLSLAISRVSAATFDSNLDAGSNTYNIGKLATPWQTIFLSQGSAVSPSYTFGGDNDTGIFSPVANSLGISTNGSERLRVDASGNVGIGVTSPTAKLHIGGGLGDGLRFPDGTLQTTAFTGAAGGGIVNSVANTDSSLIIAPTQGSVIASLNLGKANTWTAAQTFSGGANFPAGGSWDTQGNVAIGIPSTPATKLEVNGWAKTPSNTPSNTVGFRAGNNYALGMQGYVNNDADSVIFQNAYAVGGSGSPATYNWVTTHASFGSRGIAFSYLKGIQFFADNAPTFTNNSFTPTEVARITNSGNFGIGTANPGAKLELAGGDFLAGSGIILGGVRRTTWPGGVDPPIFQSEIYGSAGDLPFRTTATALQTMRYIYGPFSYGTPTCPAGYSKQFRLYAEYVDNITGVQSPEVQITFTTGVPPPPPLLFTLTKANGGSPSYLTFLSALFPDPATSSDANIQTRVNGVAPGPYVEIRKLELWTYCI